MLCPYLISQKKAWTYYIVKQNFLHPRMALFRLEGAGRGGSREARKEGARRAVALGTRRRFSLRSLIGAKGDHNSLSHSQVSGCAHQSQVQGQGRSGSLQKGQGGIFRGSVLRCPRKSGRAAL